MATLSKSSIERERLVMMILIRSSSSYIKERKSTSADIFGSRVPCNSFAWIAQGRIVETVLSNSEKQTH